MTGLDGKRPQRLGRRSPSGLLLLCALAACAVEPPAAGPSAAGGPASLRVAFVEMETGVDFRHQTGTGEDYTMPAMMGGGAALLDYDNDGDLDLYLVQAGDALPGSGRPNRSPNRLYRQQEDGRFSDLTEVSGTGDLGYGMGCAVADVDNDGWDDLYVTNWGPDALYRNRGDGTFAEVSEEWGVAGSELSSSAAFLDYDRDGYLDLYVAHYVDYDPRRRCTQEGGRRDYCGPTQFPAVSDTLYRNLAGRGFEDTSRRAGIAAVREAGLGVVAADFDDDGWIDLYVANDADPNLLWRNQGDGTFADEAILLGAAFNAYGVAEAGMGIAVGDADRDGDLDLFVSHLIEETSTYYENSGAEGFEDATARLGLAAPSVPYTGFGTAFFDYDNDGDLDLGVVNGGVKRRPTVLGRRPDWFWADYAEPNQLFQNLLVERGEARFVDVSSEAGPLGAEVEVSRGLLPADLDGDGDLDLLVTNLEGPARLYRNEGGNREAWLAIDLVDGERRREALGARVRVVASGQTYVRPAVPSGGYLTSGPARIHLGLGAIGEVERFEVRWPSGEEETFPGVATRRRVELRRGEGEVVQSAGDLPLGEPR